MSGPSSSQDLLQPWEPRPRRVAIEGPVLLLIGPLGLFFSRLARHLERSGVPVWKVSFPLYEFGFQSRQKLPFNHDMAEFRGFLEKHIQEKDIRHVFMYGDFLEPHRIAIDLINDLNQQSDRKHSIDALVFELGYIRPNYVSLERNQVNARSSLNKPVDFYHSLPAVQVIPQARMESGLRWRKCWKTPTFIQHAFTSYRIIEGEHKLQPRPHYILAQYIGFLRKYLYLFTESSQRKRLADGTPYFLVPLQVANDSQVTTSSHYQGMEPFIEELIASFAIHAPAGDRLAFKHHPRDRGYNHYGRLISRLSRQHQISDRVIYFHDGALGPTLKRARGVITINSTVGLQALYHAVPTKVMGKTFYDMPGLTDQKDLAGFWQQPAPSDRNLFRKFYLHLLESTQINGNFDGRFPFRETFQIAPELAVHAAGPSPSPLAVLQRLIRLSRGLGAYLLQLLLLSIGARTAARRLLEEAAQLSLRGLGIQVLMDRRVDDIDRPQIHIANHDHPLDALLVQGYFRNCSIAHPTRHLQRWLPFFNLSMRNYGHLKPSQRPIHSRQAGQGTQLRRLMAVLRAGGNLFLYASNAPSWSRDADIDVPLSLLLLARRCDAVLVPWTCEYRGIGLGEQPWRRRPLALIVSRLFGPQATVLCREGEAIDPRRFNGNPELAACIRRAYDRHRQATRAA